MIVAALYERRIYINFAVTDRRHNNLRFIPPRLQDRPALRRRQPIQTISWVAQLLLFRSNRRPTTLALKELPDLAGFGDIFLNLAPRFARLVIDA